MEKKLEKYNYQVIDLKTLLQGSCLRKSSLDIKD